MCVLRLAGSVRVSSVVGSDRPTDRPVDRPIVQPYTHTQNQEQTLTSYTSYKSCKAVKDANACAFYKTYCAKGKLARGAKHPTNAAATTTTTTTTAPPLPHIPIRVAVACGECEDDDDGLFAETSWQTWTDAITLNVEVGGRVAIPSSLSPGCSHGAHCCGVTTTMATDIFAVSNANLTSTSARHRPPRKNPTLPFTAHHPLAGVFGCVHDPLLFHRTKSGSGGRVQHLGIL